MKKTNYIYSFISLAFIILFVLSLFIDFEPRIIIGYSIVSFIFSIIDLLNTLGDGRTKIRELSENDFDNMISELVTTMQEEIKETMKGLKKGIEQISTARQELLSLIISEQFDVEKAQASGLNKPSKTVLNTHKKQNEIGMGMINKLFSSIDMIKPSNTFTAIDGVNLFLFMLATCLLISSPFIPEQFYGIIFKSKLPMVGVSLTLLSLSIIFLTSFIRIYYHEKIERLQYESYYKMTSAFTNLKGILDFREEEVNQQTEQFQKMLKEMGKLMSMALENEINRPRDIERPDENIE